MDCQAAFARHFCDIDTILVSVHGIGTCVVFSLVLT